MEALKFKEDGKTLTAKLSGELDHYLAVGVRERIDAEFYRARPDVLILDISGITFMDSSGLGLIMGRSAVCKRAGAEFRLRGADKRAEMILAMAGLSSVIKKDTGERSDPR